MNIINALFSKLLNQNTAFQQTPIDIKQAQVKMLANRFTKRSFLTPKILAGGTMFAGLWWLTNRREKVKEAEQEKKASNKKE